MKLLAPLGAPVNWVITMLEMALPITLERTPLTIIVSPATGAPAAVNLIVTVPPILGTLALVVTVKAGKPAAAVTLIPFGRIATPATLATLRATWLGVIAD
jgi:hypothetical protein